MTQPEEQRSSQNEFVELQNLLLGDQLRQLEELRRRLDDPNLRSQETSKIFVQALSLSVQADRRLQPTLQPVVEEALRISVERDPQLLANALFPIVGQAVRKAVAHSMQQILDSLNSVLANGFSLERWGWRIEALRSGKSFGEIALARSLTYRVEHVYLIHRKTGLLLAESSRDPDLLGDPSLVVGMLTALQDFVRDSFTTNKQDDLEVLHIGEFKVWLLHGPLAILALVVRGQLPPQLEAAFSDRIEAINETFRPQLASFEATGRPIAGIDARLDDFLLGTASAAAPSYTKPKVAAGLVLTAALVAAFFPLCAGIRWHNYLRALKAEPGVVVIDAHRGWSTFSLAGLRDPMAADPYSLLAKYHLSPSKVNEQWGQYLSLDPRFAGARRLRDEAASLHKQAVYFEEDAADIPMGQLPVLDTIGDQMRALIADATAQGKQIQIQVVGHTDRTGSESRNAEVSQQRAQTMIALLGARGIDPKYFSAMGLGHAAPDGPGADAYEDYLDRRVTFNVLLDGKQ
ncbi:OmpA family protein [Granulicella sp. 5B5]|uniref:OmpA family protein n=1 Tax=Granulicella sp. 5B5 TaxID=1617967 RepID=UPI0015F7032F|nr:OmpA family protein [Granulicella sp. 5B5]QMV18405.1 OmpA family protein [Granulicella sp. 5B5]